MASIAFTHPIDIDGISISDADAAADYLLNNWPVDSGERYDFAKRVCLEVIEGKRDPEDARAAFLLAAEEAGVILAR
ncbi:DUF982 domain-containing protein [Labrys sp. LIt4]|uniref:DUF982 domain-containing protein n=1 Tax=Labrys okinawensis TaxID=346911 RepID=A0A2S9QII5_9HYPH|nr:MULTISPECIES: DUF982 domain-containing protein [Labrys]MBP0581113.1 DUF982 domain-containing protein [Labrys sp. LIt4]PRH89171.1 DUF982 domain-containing protein [Labrys okinawensis]